MKKYKRGQKVIFRHLTFELIDDEIQTILKESIGEIVDVETFHFVMGANDTDTTLYTIREAKTRKLFSVGGHTEIVEEVENV